MKPFVYRERIAQIDYEINGLIDIFKREGVRSYLEIGSQYGGSLWRVANALPKGSRIVSVDLPWGDRNTEPHLKACVAELKREGYDAHLFTDDSTKAGVIHHVAGLAPFDTCFIDANHTLPYVTKDWQNYGPMARIVAFHDIVWDRPVRPGRLPIEVAKLWREIKSGYMHQEIVAPGSEKGIGVIWRS